MKHLFLIIALITSSVNLAAHAPSGTVTGTVLDAELKEPIPYATIIVNDMEGTMVTGTTSLGDGSFSVEKIPFGKYILKVQFIGYKAFSRELVVSEENNSFELGEILLETDYAQLEEVNIVAERSTIEQRIDRKVINVGKDLTTTGATAAEIMNKVPSVSMDQNGNIALRGNSNVRILLDGKPTNIPPSQLLKQIPSTSIKSIELITNPSAKYNPEGMSGIINIVLHKNSNEGFNGNLSTGLTVGENARFNANLNLNYREGKFNFYGNLGVNTGEREHLNELRLPASNSQQNIFILNNNDSYLYKIGVDYYMNERNTLSFYTNQNHYEGGPEVELHALYFDDPARNFRQLLDLGFENNNSTYNFVYKREFEKEGQELELELDYSQQDEEEDVSSVFSEGTSFLPYSEQVILNGENFIANLDFVNPIGESMKLEMGAEARILGREEDYTTDQAIEDFFYEYNRDIYSFYTTFGQRLEKWSYQLGARLESYSATADVENALAYEEDYISLYPSGFVNYTPNEKDSYQLSYSRRVDRPRLSQVSPIREVSTPTILIEGNPELDPQFTNSLEMNYTRDLPKGSISGGVFFRNINDNINQIILEDPETPGNLIISYGNFDDTNAYGLEVSGNYSLTDWWSANASFELYSQEQRGVVGTEYYEVENTSFSARMNNSFKLGESLTLQLFGYYRAPNEGLQARMESVYFVNFGGRYSFFNDRASVSLNFNDIFNTQEYRGTSERPFPQTFYFKGETQTVYVGLSYRFGGLKNRALQRKQRDDNQVDGGGMF